MNLNKQESNCKDCVARLQSFYSVSINTQIGQIDYIYNYNHNREYHSKCCETMPKTIPMTRPKLDHKLHQNYRP